MPAPRSLDVARHPEAFAIGLLLLTVAIWGSTPQVTDVGSGYADPLTLTTLRAAPTPLVLLLALPFLRFRLPRGRLAWLLTASGGLLMVGVFLGGFTEAVIRAGPGNSIVLSSTSPFWVAIIARVVFGERISLRTATGLLIGFAGVIVVFSSQLGATASAGRTVTGLIFALAAAIGWASGTFIVREQLTRQPDSDLLGVVAGQYLVGGTALLILTLAVDGTGGARWSSADLWMSVAYLVVVGSAIATVAYFGALRVIRPTRATTWSFLTPVVAILIGIGLGDVPHPAVFAGMAITIAGVIIVNLPERRAITATSATAPQTQPSSPLLAAAADTQAPTPVIAATPGGAAETRAS